MGDETEDEKMNLVTPVTVINQSPVPQKSSPKKTSWPSWSFPLIIGILIILVIVLIVALASSNNEALPNQPAPAPPTARASNQPTAFPTSPTPGPTASTTTKDAEKLTSETNTFHYDWSGDDLPSKNAVEATFKRLFPDISQINVIRLDEGEIRFTWTSTVLDTLDEKTVAKVLNASYPGGVKEVIKMDIYNPYKLENPTLWPCPFVGTTTCVQTGFFWTIVGSILVPLFCCCCYVFPNGFFGNDPNYSSKH